MEIILIKALQLILSLSILVVIHEFGHFLFARLFHIRVEKFYLFFNPWFSLFKFKPKNSDTEYGIGWLPLGGYVKISGMIDESMDKEQMALPPQPWEFRSKPAWQRLLVMVGGVMFNFILAVLIYSMVMFTWGESFLPLKNAKMGMEFSETAKKMGFQDGDILLKADTTTLERLGEKMIYQIAEAKHVTVLRNGVETQVAIPDTFMTALISEKKGFCNYLMPCVVADVVADSPAAKAGLQPKDSIVGINGIQASTFNKISKTITEKKGETINLTFYRAGVEKTLPIEVTKDGKIGFYPNNPFELVSINYNFFESFPKGIELGVQTLSSYVGQFKYVFTKEGASSIGGFGAIGNLFPAQWDWHSFWMMTAFLSIILAFMNILPIPALDGGHVMFLLYEVITRRKPNEKFMEYAQMVGMIILFGLLIYANGNDIFRAIFK